MSALRRLLAMVFSKRDKVDVPASTLSDLEALAARPAPQDVTGWLDEAQALASLGHWEGAIPCLDKAIDLDPQCATAWHDKARCLGALGRLDEAIDCYAQALNVDPQMAAAWFGKALAEEKLGYMQDAIRSYERYLAVGLDEHPEQLEYVRHSLRDLRCGGEAWAEGPALRERLSSTSAVQQSSAGSSAREEVTRHRERVAEAPNARRTKARARIRPLGKSRGSRLQIRPPRIERLAPYLLLIPLGLVFGLIIVLIRNCDSSEIGFYPSSPQSSNPIRSSGDFSDFGQGSRAYFLGEYDAAIRYFTAALDSHSPIGDVYNRRALAYDAKGEYEKALQDYELALLAFEQALRLDSGPAMVHNNRACTFFALGEYDQAMADLSRAIELQSTFGKAYYNRGLVHSNLGDYDAAIADLNKALLYPASESESSLLLFYQALAQRPNSSFGDWLEAEELEAEEMEREFLETGADTPSVLYQRARVYAAQGEIESALPDLDRAIDLLTDRLAKTTAVLSRLESTPSSETTAAPGEEDGPENPRVDLPSVYYLRALIYAEKGEYGGAVADMERVLQLTDDEEMQGQVELALALLRALLAGQGTGLPEDMASNILFGLPEGAGRRDRATAAMPKSTAMPAARTNGTPAPSLPALYAPQPDETPTTPIWEKPQAACDDRPLYMWSSPGTYIYRITDGSGAERSVMQRQAGTRARASYPFSCDYPELDITSLASNFGESFAEPPKPGSSTGMPACRPPQAVIAGYGTISTTVAGTETKRTQLGAFEAVRVDTNLKYSVTTGAHNTYEKTAEKSEWYACGYGLVHSTASLTEMANSGKVGQSSSQVTLISYTPSSTNESHVRYILADLSLSNNIGSYRSGIVDEETAEALRRWDAGIRVVNACDFEHRLVDGHWRIVYSETGGPIDGMSVILTIDAQQ